MKKTVTLSDQRKLGYYDVGDDKGHVVMYFHGVPSASDEWRVWGSEEMLKALKIRLIAIDRPGTGGSSFQKNRCFKDWPKDVAELADKLGIDRFSVFGYSGGGPYAAVCALMIPERLKSAAIVSSVVSFDHTELLEGINQQNVKFLNLSWQKPRLFRFIYSQIGLMGKIAPKKYLKNALATFEPADAEVFSIPKVHKAIFSSGGSAKGEQWDTKLIVSAWDFKPEDIKMHVSLWQGGKDHNASPLMGRHLGKTIPHNTMHFLPEEGHVSLVVKNIETILKELINVQQV